MSYTLTTNHEGETLLSGEGCDPINGTLMQRIRGWLIRHLVGRSLVITNATLVDGVIPVSEAQPVYVYNAQGFTIAFTEGRFSIMIDNLRKQGCLIEDKQERESPNP